MRACSLPRTVKRSRRLSTWADGVSSLRKKGAAPTHQSPRRPLRERKTRVGRTDTQTGMLPGVPGSTTCVQRFDDSRNSAIHITYRISLRSSSLREPRHPLLKVVYWFVLVGSFALLRGERRCKAPISLFRLLKKGWFIKMNEKKWAVPGKLPISLKKQQTSRNKHQTTSRWVGIGSVW